MGDGFDPSLGFVPRTAVKVYGLSAVFAPRLQGTFIRQMFHEFFANYVTNLQGVRESYRVFMAPINWRLESGDRVEANVVLTGERLFAPFEIAEGVVIPAGTYDYAIERGPEYERQSGQVTISVAEPCRLAVRLARSAPSDAALPLRRFAAASMTSPSTADAVGLPPAPRP